jgi:hypothetical protein
MPAQAESPIMGYNENAHFMGTNYNDVGAELSNGRFGIKAGNYFPVNTVHDEEMHTFNPHLNVNTHLGNNINLGAELSPEYSGISFSKHFAKGGIYLGHFKYENGGLVRMDTGGTDPSQPYMYLDTKNNVNSWMRPPENPDPTKMIDWERYNPVFVKAPVTITAKRSSPEDAAKARAAYLQTPEGQEEARQKYMQEFVDQQNNSKSPLQASLGNLSLDNPATRDAARNYAGYKLGESSPMWATDRMLTGHDTPTTQDFYRPHEATTSFGIPAAIASAVALGSGAPELAAGYQLVSEAAAPFLEATESALNKPLFNNTALSLNNIGKLSTGYNLARNTAPEAYKGFEDYSKTGKTEDLMRGVGNTGRLALEAAYLSPAFNGLNKTREAVSASEDLSELPHAENASDVGRSLLGTVSGVSGMLAHRDGGKVKRFNTKLRGDELKAFNEHAKQFPSLLNDNADYDTQGFYQAVYRDKNGDIDAIAKALTPGSDTAHVGFDMFKKPNHPTFSKESKYYIPGLRPAGEWGHNQAGDYFDASRHNLRNMKKSDGTPLEYFKRAEDYDQNGTPDVNMYYRGKTQFDTETTPAGTLQPRLTRAAFADGGPNFKTKLSSKEENQFKAFYKTLPDNLRSDDASYDIRGYWDASGRPTQFDYSQPKQDDGYYHAFSRHPETGKILKSPGHPTFHMAVDERNVEGNTYVPMVGPDGNVYMRDLNQDAEDLQRHKQGGSVKRVKIKSLPKNWKSQ